MKEEETSDKNREGQERRGKEEREGNSKEETRGERQMKEKFKIFTLLFKH